MIAWLCDEGTRMLMKIAMEDRVEDLSRQRVLEKTLDSCNTWNDMMDLQQISQEFSVDGLWS
jgi:hypothetical protein